jgi:hypothetical protein
MEHELDAHLKKCSSAEAIEFLLDCVPFIHEMATETKEVKEKTVMGIQKTAGLNRGDIYRRFHEKVFNGIETTEYINIYQCKCGSMNTLHTSEWEQVCSDCGYAEFIDTDEIGFKEEQEMDKTVAYSYKKENHFNEWMLQFQAKESTTVPTQLIEAIKAELKKQKITNKSEITHAKMREILKKLKYNKFYEHVPYIATLVSGITPPIMPQELEDRLRMMFYQIQAPFKQHCPGDRTNFLSYSYVLYKFCELLGEDQYLPCFPLLKSSDKLYKHDQIWRKICEDLRWQFISTI